MKAQEELLLAQTSEGSEKDYLETLQNQIVATNERLRQLFNDTMAQKPTQEL